MNNHSKHLLVGASGIAVLTIVCLSTWAAQTPINSEHVTPFKPVAPPLSDKGEVVRYPSFTPLVNVREFGAKGDGVTDDTAAIQRAIESKPQARQIFFPPGTYLLSKTLVGLSSQKINPNGRDVYMFPLEPGQTGSPQSWLQFYGSGRGHTRLKLRDNLPDFQDPEAARSMIQFRAVREPIGTGANRVLKEQPNVAFFNSIYDITLDVGIGNPGAVGVDWVVCNSGALRRVDIISSDPNGVGSVGVRMDKNDGTSFIRDVRISGFDTGLWRSDNAQTLAIEGLHLQNQRKVGIYNHDSVFAVHNLTSQNRGPSLIQATGTAQASILNARISGGASVPFVQQNANAMLYLSDVQAEGSQTLVQSVGASLQKADFSGEWFSHPAASKGKAASLGLSVKVAPEFHDSDVSKWVNVADFSDDGTGNFSVRFQKAVDSGAQTIVMDSRGARKYLTPVVVRGNVRRIIGFWNSSIPPSPSPNYVRSYGHGATDNMIAATQGDSTKAGAFFMRIDETSGDSVTIEQFHHFPGGILNNSPKTLVLRDMPSFAYANTPNGTGDLFAEGTMGAFYRIAHGQKAWLRSVDAVFGRGPDIQVDNATVWILSNRTEGGGVFVEAVNGAKVEIISTSHFIGSRGVGDDLAYRVRDSDFSLINFSETGFVSQGVYKNLILDTQNGRETIIGRNSDGVMKRNNLNKLMFYRSGAQEVQIQ